jgi:hypothetical protein
MSTITAVDLKIAGLIIGPGFDLTSFAPPLNPDIEGPFQPPRI